MRKVDWLISTDGSGLWSIEERTVHVTGLDLILFESLGSPDEDDYLDMHDYGELRVYFDTKTWNVKKDGLIYTDGKFLRGLRLTFASHGISMEDAYCIDYSEQGMQGVDYVSFDVDKPFIQAWLKK